MGALAKLGGAAVLALVAAGVSGHAAFKAGPTTTSANERLGMLMAAEAGWDKAQRHCLNLLWTRESGWQASVWNYQGSGAYGIPQALPASKMASAGPDWRTNPATQMRWGIGYLKSVYGTPCAAWTHETNFGWY